MRAALITHPDCLKHAADPSNLERAERLIAILHVLNSHEFADLRRETAPRATRKQLIRAHDANYVEAILETRPDPGELVKLDADTVMSARSAEAALRAAGAAVAAVNWVMAGRNCAAFAAVRPPGHHAEQRRAMGYCIFNNAAVAARHARAEWGLRRVAVVDFDAHHGNGTQNMFAGDPHLFYGSSHQEPCYPGTGRAWEHGVANNIVNAPLLPGSGSKAFRAAWINVILPALDTFAPELLIVSAGFDAHKCDPSADLLVESSDYAWLTHELMQATAVHTCGRLVSVLEGGYELNAAATSAAAHVLALIRR